MVEFQGFSSFLYQEKDVERTVLSGRNISRKKVSFYPDTVTHVNLGDRKLILARVDRQRLYLLMSVSLTDRTSGEDYVSLAQSSPAPPANQCLVSVQF